MIKMIIVNSIKENDKNNEYNNNAKYIVVYYDNKRL